MVSVVFQVGLPGVQELIIILLNFIILAGLVGGLIVVVKRLTGNDSKSDERIAELEREVEELREERGTGTDEPDDELE
ncbi:preprotein translocase subunit TatA [Halobacteria archaeon HArc-gm2]|nr:preprotein translocase subunit TatA [Halobacteria archaeon HArc-gm2]